MSTVLLFKMYDLSHHQLGEKIDPPQIILLKSQEPIRGFSDIKGIKFLGTAN